MPRSTAAGFPRESSHIAKKNSTQRSPGKPRTGRRRPMLLACCTKDQCRRVARFRNLDTRLRIVGQRIQERRRRCVGADVCPLAEQKPGIPIPPSRSEGGRGRSQRIFIPPTRSGNSVLRLPIDGVPESASPTSDAVWQRFRRRPRLRSSRVKQVPIRRHCQSSCPWFQQLHRIQPREAAERAVGQSRSPPAGFRRPRGSGKARPEGALEAAAGGGGAGA